MTQASVYSSFEQQQISVINRDIRLPTTDTKKNYELSDNYTIVPAVALILYPGQHIMHQC